MRFRTTYFIAITLSSYETIVTRVSSQILSNHRIYGFGFKSSLWSTVRCKRSEVSTPHSCRLKGLAFDRKMEETQSLTEYVWPKKLTTLIPRTFANTDDCNTSTAPLRYHQNHTVTTLSNPIIQSHKEYSLSHPHWFEHFIRIIYNRKKEKIMKSIKKSLLAQPLWGWNVELTYIP